MHLVLQLTVFLVIFQGIVSAPIKSEDERKGKNLAFFDYIQPDITANDYSNYEVDNDYSLDLDDNDLSRTIPSRKRYQTQPQPYNSPIYYIRLPPQPYMFVPGLGYMSQPPPSPMSQFVNLPVSFVSNGKPGTIYQWSGGMNLFPTEAPPKPTKKPVQKPVKKPVDSNVHRLPGQYMFNGKPEDIFVLRDSYNSLYSDALQNFYP